MFCPSIQFEEENEEIEEEVNLLCHIYERPNFYVENGLLVIEEGDWHNKMIIRFEDIDSLIEPKYKKCFIN